MGGFKDLGLLDRRAAAATAKKAALERFRAQPGADDPSVAQRDKARRAVTEARGLRAEERVAAKLAREVQLAEQKVRDAVLAKQAAQESKERAAREKREIADREVALNAERKVERDARYAARKSRRK
jgi:hypothetical protein